MANIDTIIIARFWSKVDVKKSNTSCWNWNGAKNTNGYGTFRQRPREKLYLAHRLAYMIYHADEIGEGKVIRHICDNPSCVNPRHLTEGTQLENINDAVNRGRVYKKLRSGEVDEIIRLRKMGLSIKAIGEMFGVSKTPISRICNDYQVPKYIKEFQSTGSHHRPIT